MIRLTAEQVELVNRRSLAEENFEVTTEWCMACDQHGDCNYRTEDIAAVYAEYIHPDCGSELLTDCWVDMSYRRFGNRDRSMQERLRDGE